MHTVSLVLTPALAAVPLAAQPSVSSDKAAVLATITKFDKAFNAGDTKATAAVRASHTIIIDGSPPHMWQGVEICAKWMNDLDAFAKQNDITNSIVTMGKP